MDLIAYAQTLRGPVLQPQQHGRKGSRLVITLRPPRRRSASTCQCSHTHTLRRIKATATYKKRSSGSRVQVVIRARCNCRYVVSIANRVRYVSLTH
jgi:hypothetical protein